MGWVGYRKAGRATKILWPAMIIVPTIGIFVWMFMEECASHEVMTPEEARGKAAPSGRLTGSAVIPSSSAIAPAGAAPSASSAPSARPAARTPRK